MSNRLDWRRRVLPVACCLVVSLVQVAALSPTFAVESETMVGSSVLAGFVYVDRDNDGIINFAGSQKPDFAIEGVEIRLYENTGSGYELLDTTTSNAGGRYIFTGLSEGTYALKQTQPVEFVDGKDTIGMLINKSGQPLPAHASPGHVVDGGNGFEDIVLPENTRGDMYNFGEQGLAPGFVSKRYFLAYPPTFPHVIPEPSSFVLLLMAGMANGRMLRMRRTG